MPSLPLVSDAAASQDKLDFEGLASTIHSKLFKEPTDLIRTSPFAVGIFGPWGSGKSTFLELLSTDLEKLTPKADKKAPLVVRFSPWRHNSSESLLLAMLGEMAGTDSSFEKLLQWVAGNSKPIGDAAKTMGLLSADVATFGLPVLTMLNAFLTKEKEAGGAETEKTPQVFQLHEKIRETIEKATKDRRLVFLIDDLDRCQDPRHAVLVLEQIKLFLDSPRCVFFIAADRARLVRSIETVFPNQGTDYLDKFIQLPVFLPQSHRADAVGLLPLDQASKEAAYAQKIAAVLRSNPRQIKKLYNQSVIDFESAKSSWADTKQWFSGCVAEHEEPDLRYALKVNLITDILDSWDSPYRITQLARAAAEQASSDPPPREPGYWANDFDLRHQPNPKEAPEIWEWRSETHQRLAHFLLDDTVIDLCSPVTSLYIDGSGRLRKGLADFLEERRVSDPSFEATNIDFQASADLSDANFSGMTFRHCKFFAANTTGTDFRHCTFIDCEFRAIAADKTTLSESSFVRCRGMLEITVLYASEEAWEQAADLRLAMAESLQEEAQATTKSEGLASELGDILGELRVLRSTEVAPPSGKGGSTKGRLTKVIKAMTASERVLVRG